MSGAGPSIRRRLLAMLLGTILLAWLVVLVLVYRTAGHEVEEVFDADLARSARVLQTLLRHEVEEEQEMTDRLQAFIVELGDEGMARYPNLADTLRHYADEENRERLELVSDVQEAAHQYGAGLFFIARYADGSVMVRDHAAPEIPITQAGFEDLQRDGQQWRVYRLTDEQTGLTVQVGERHAFRNELVGYITRNTLMPLLLAFPILALVIWAIVGGALRPLRRVAEEVSQREPDSLGPVDSTNTPREVHGLLSALNGLFVRVQSVIDRERRFTADAAHELRTPLAALKAHLQVAQARSVDQETAASLGAALDGVDRATHSVEQLLVLARADAQQAKSLVGHPVDLGDVARNCVAQLSQMAFERQVDLGVDGRESIMVTGDDTALHLLLRNLVDNAIRYTPRGGKVNVSVGQDAGGRWIRVQDNGKGIDAGDRERVFERFYRGTGERAAGTNGSGLGLSIVQRVASLHGARVAIGEGLDGAGLGVSVVFPAA